MAYGVHCLNNKNNTVLLEGWFYKELYPAKQVNSIYFPLNKVVSKSYIKHGSMIG